VPADRLAEVFSDVSAVVVPSLAGEVFGLVVAENMLRGKALIVSDLGSLAEIAGDAGIIVPGGKAAALAAAMRRLIEAPAQASSLGGKGAKRAAKLFDMKGMIQSHVSVYSDVVR
jgi:glycosyltransferase involved in cell wall biosynthesis